MGRIFVKENGHLSLGSRGFRSGTKYLKKPIHFIALFVIYAINIIAACAGKIRVTG